jgi:lysozyme
MAAALCRRFEGCYLRPYLCPAGVATVGFGATHYVDGRPVRMSDPAITRDAAERMLLLQLERTYMPAVLALCPGLEGARLAAITDFAFNLGTGALRASTLRRRINAGDWGAVPGELRRWVRGGGRVLRGLVLRREAEIETLTARPN